MTKQGMLDKLHSHGSGTMFPVFIPSMNRAGKSATINKIVLAQFDQEAIDRTYVVVRREQYKEYKRAYPTLNILPLTGEINGLASTRQWICDYAAEHRMPYIVDMDDDITEFEFLYSSVSCNGNKQSSLSVKADGIDEMGTNLLGLASEISREVFRKYPNAWYGNIRRRRMSQGEENALVKYQVQAGPTPRQVTFVNVKGLHKAGVRRDMIFDPHGDDIGFAAVVLANGGYCFNIPCLAYSYIDEKCDSVVRTPENSKKLHKYEWNMLQRYPIKDYLRVSFRDENGNYMWGDIDWTKYHKLYGTKRIKVRWED